MASRTFTNSQTGVVTAAPNVNASPTILSYWHFAIFGAIGGLMVGLGVLLALAISHHL